MLLRLLMCFVFLKVAAAQLPINVAVLSPPSPEIVSGIMAAQLEANDAGAIPGYALNITFYDVINVPIADLIALIGAIDANPSTFGYLMPFWGVSDLLIELSYHFQDFTHPIIAPLTGMLELPFASTSRHVVNFRPPFISEMYQLLYYALHSRTHCVAFCSDCHEYHLLADVHVRCDNSCAELDVVSGSAEHISAGKPFGRRPCVYAKEILFQRQRPDV